MTNRIIKKSHFAKSKILLIVLCILGLVFSYSCSCRNNSTAPNTPEGNTQTNNTNAFIPIASKIYNATNSALIASEDGTQKTHIKIKFDEANHKIKNATLKKMVDTNGNDLTTKATYTFADLSLGFVASDLQSILSGMDSSTAPATNEFTLTFELSTDSKTSTNTTATVENVKVQIVKTQKFDNQATILQSIISSIGSPIVSKKVSFNFSESGKAGLELIELENASKGNGAADNNVAKDYIDDIINNHSHAIKKNNDYNKYFDNVVSEEPNISDTPNLTIKLNFTPKNIYDMALTTYTIKLDNLLDNLDGGNWK